MGWRVVVRANDHEMWSSQNLADAACYRFEVESQELYYKTGLRPLDVTLYRRPSLHILIVNASYTTD